jgi:hypothetical protein
MESRNLTPYLNPLPVEGRGDGIRTVLICPMIATVGWELAGMASCPAEKTARQPNPAPIAKSSVNTKPPPWQSAAADVKNAKTISGGGRTPAQARTRRTTPRWKVRVPH